MVSEEIVIESVESGRFKLLIDRGHVIFEKEDDVIGSGLLFSFNNEEKYTFVYRIKNQRFESVRLKDLLIETVHGNLTEESVLNIEKACFRGM